MASLIAQGLCCCFSCCCQEISDALKRLLGPEKVTKVFYLFLVVIFTVPAIAILFFLNDIQPFLEHFSWLSCPQSSGGGQFGCVGPSAVYRMSLSVFCLFGLMLLVVFCRCRLAMIINEGLFCFKYLLVTAVFIAFLWADNKSFQDYANASKYISIGFMLIQSVILIDLFYLAGIRLVEHYDQGESSYACLLIFLTILFEAGALVMNILGYVYFAKQDACGDSLWINIANSVILVVLPLVQLLNFNKQNSLLTTALVSMYVSYQCFICQFSFGGDACTQRMTVGSLAIDIIISTVFFILTMYGSIMGGSGRVKVSENTDLHAAMGMKANKEQTQEREDSARPQLAPAQNKDSQDVNLARYTQSWDWVKWHFYMCLASIYIGMLVTNWSSASLTTGELISNDFGFWVRAIIAMLTTFLYIWTLVVPKLCPSRDFTVV